MDDTEHPAREQEYVTSDVLRPEHYADLRPEARPEVAQGRTTDGDWGTHGGDDGAREHERAEAHIAEETGNPNREAGATPV